MLKFYETPESTGEMETDDQQVFAQFLWSTGNCFWCYSMQASIWILSKRAVIYLKLFWHQGFSLLKVKLLDFLWDFVLKYKRLEAFVRRKGEFSTFLPREETRCLVKF